MSSGNRWPRDATIRGSFTAAIEADIGSEDRREFDRLDDVAVEGVDVNLTGLDRGRLSFRLLLLSGPRRLRGLRRFRGLRSPYAAFRGRLGIRGSRGALLVLGIRHAVTPPAWIHGRCT